MKVLSIFILFIFVFGVSCIEQNPKLVDLRVEYLKDPLQLAVKKPLFSWKMNSPKDNINQMAYQIKVWTSDEELWDSGKVDSDESVGIKYEGKELVSNTDAFWEVKAWDNKGNIMTSAIASFSTGLYNTDDWKAKWIKLPEPPLKNVVFDTSMIKWMWYPEARDGKANPRGKRFFKKSLTIEDVSQLKSVQSVFAGDDVFKLSINGEIVQKGGWQNIDNRDLRYSFKNGENTLLLECYNRITSAGVAGQLVFEFNDAKMKIITTDDTWEASKDNINWSSSVAFAPFGCKEYDEWFHIKSISRKKYLPATYVRKKFVLEKRVSQAKLYATALGAYEVYLNGERISDYVLAPGFTDYRKRVLYQAYDITKHLKKSKTNTIGAIIGDGWYAGSLTWNDKRNYFGVFHEFLLQINIEYDDGSKETIISDKTWKGNTGPIVYSDIFDGEFYNANLEFDNWAENRFNDDDWQNVEERNINENICADAGVPVERIMDMKPVKAFEPLKNVYSFDLGQNIVGWIQFKVRGNKGDTLMFKFAEMLKEDSTVYTEALRDASATDFYILKGEGEEIFEPHFTFHGFRYIQVHGCTNKPSINDLTGKVIHSKMEVTGDFECSNPLVNKIYQNAMWGQRGNFLSVPTDCPQRDERLGWLGDAQVFVKPASYNMDVCAFFNKWMYDVVDGQSKEGAFPNLAPSVAAFNMGTPAWADAGIIVPLTIHDFYNNKAMLSQHYNAFVKWVEYVKSNNPDLIWRNKLGSNYSDWLNTNAITNDTLLATAFFAYSAHSLSKIANVLNKEDDAHKYNVLYENIKKSFCRVFLDENNKIKDTTQTACVLPLAFDILPDNVKPVVTKQLVENIKRRNMHHSTGFIGIGHLLPVLTENGFNDIAFRLIANNTFPSLGFMVENGATTIWERWNGYTKEDGFADASMNSFNHYSLGSPVVWLYSHLTGIQPLQSGFKKIRIKPYPVNDLSFARSSFHSVYGKIVSKWELNNKKLVMHVSIPDNTTAEIWVPAKNIESKVERKSEVSGWTIFECGSGEYTFTGDFAL